MARTLTQFQTNISQRTFHSGTVYNTQIMNFVNQAKNMIISVAHGKYEWLANQTTLSLSAGDYRKEIPSSLNFVSLRTPNGVYDETDDIYLDIVDWDYFLENASWRPKTSAPTSADYGTIAMCSITDIIETTLKKYIYFDVPTSESKTVRLHFYRKCADLSTGSDTFLGMPVEYEDAIEEFAVWMITVVKDANVTKEQILKSNFGEFLQAINVGSDKTHSVNQSIKVNTYREPFDYAGIRRI